MRVVESLAGNPLQAQVDAAAAVKARRVAAHEEYGRRLNPQMFAGEVKAKMDRELLFGESADA